ncbi:hypothetical protein L3X38_036717 [Prunus dulcis]|uniref:Uncharacterized protein n=1 Tax=Prunus dulcis TaxID=3755 RepID=A0AAD4V1Q7_PRUDU|nr:hypothetical protein L3X38_036717 [Prunus dulcis]
MQISKGNRERGNGQTTCGVKSGRWLRKSLSDNYILSTGTCKYLKANGNRKTGQPPVHSNRAGGWGNHGRIPNCVLSTGRSLGKSLSDTCVLSTDTCKHLKATETAAIGQPPVQSNWAGGWGNHCGTTTCELSTGTRNYLKGNWERGNWPTTCAVKSGKWLEKSLSDTCVRNTGTSKYLKATSNKETRQPPMHSNWASGWAILVGPLCTKHRYKQRSKGN